MDTQTKPLRRKYDITVIDATFKAYEGLNKKFWNWELCNEVKRLRVSYYLSDSTILRRLRELKEDKKVNFIADSYGMYHKLCNCESSNNFNNSCKKCNLPIKL